MAGSVSGSSVRPARSVFRTLAWRAFYVLDGLLVVLFALAYANGYLPFDVLWWLELIAIGLPYLAAALVPAALVAALGRQWRLAGLHALLLLAFLLRTGALGRLLYHEAPHPDDLVVLTFNVPEELGDPESMAAVVGAVEPHVICLQEAAVVYYPATQTVTTKSHIEVVLDSLGYHAPQVEAEGPYYTPQPLLSRIPVGRVTSTQFQYQPDALDKTYVTRAELVWLGRPFVLYNIHLRSFGSRKPWNVTRRAATEPRLWRSFLRQYREAFQERAWEAQQIRAMLDREEHPVLVCGDFNSTPYNRAYHHLAAGRRDAFRKAGSGWGMTYHRRLPFARIDFLLASPAWAFVSAHTVPAHLSDHLPVAVRLRWRE